MIDQVVRWRHFDGNGRRLFPERAGVARAVAYTPASDQWHVLVQHHDGTFGDHLAVNLEIDPGETAAELGPPPDAPGLHEPSLHDHVRHEFSEELEATRARVVHAERQLEHLDRYLRASGLAEDPGSDPCAAAVNLFAQLTAELVEVSAAREAAQTRVTEIANERDAAAALAEKLGAELDALRKRRRPPGRVSEDA